MGNTKVITIGNQTIGTNTQTAFEVSFSHGVKAKIIKLIVKGTDVDFDIAVDGQTLGSKYGFPMKTSAFNVINVPLDVNMPIRTPSKVTGVLKGFSDTAEVTGGIVVFDIEEE